MFSIFSLYFLYIFCPSSDNVDTVFVLRFCEACFLPRFAPFSPLAAWAQFFFATLATFFCDFWHFTSIFGVFKPLKDAQKVCKQPGNIYFFCNTCPSTLRFFEAFCFLLALRYLFWARRRGSFAAPWPGDQWRLQIVTQMSLGAFTKK